MLRVGLIIDFISLHDNMELYHGSEKIIEQPEYGKGRTNNDYGR